MSATPELDLLTIREVAELLKVSEVTIARWLKQGRLPAYRVGPRAVRVRRADVERLMEPLSSPQPPDEFGRIDQAVPRRIDSTLTAEDIERGRQAWHELEMLGERIAARRGGQPLTDSAEIIRQEREKRATDERLR